MFRGFARVWTPVELSRALGRRPRALQVAGERVVLFRGPEGRAAALLDRCPHRGVALSLGRRTEGGTLACPFHGWEFDGSGACVHVPLNPAARCDLLSATALPVREAGGLIWLYTSPQGEGAQPGEPVVPETLSAPGFVRSALLTEWRTHWTRAMENMLDIPHLPFVHRRTIGFSLRRRLRRDLRMDLAWEPTEHGAHVSYTLDGGPRQHVLDFVRPNRMTLHIPAGRRRIEMHVFCVPVSDTRTRMLVLGTRDFGRLNPLAYLFDQINRIVALEDKAVVESSAPPEVPPPGQERSVPTDRPTLQFRKYYYEALRGSAAAAGLVPLQGRADGGRRAVP